MWIEASAPSNIALIKYMGKLDAAQNTPCNTSLSYTLEHLRTFVQIKENANLKNDQWSPLVRQDLRPLVLSEKGQNKYLKYFNALKKEFGINSFFEIESANNFPSDCGLASSASSFAALTLVLYNWALEKNKIDAWSIEKLALVSKSGSGSSCRSFFSPWAEWSKNEIKPVDLSIINLKHQVILCDENIKLVSSTEAHQRVISSDLFLGRPERAEKRNFNLQGALKNNEWKSAFEICWNEFWDMHTLFHTAKPAFMYMNTESQNALTILLKFWHENNDGPLITMDAGSNIHLLYREDQQKIYHRMIDLFQKHYSLWTDEGYLAKI